MFLAARGWGVDPMKAPCYSTFSLWSSKTVGSSVSVISARGAVELRTFWVRGPGAAAKRGGREFLPGARAEGKGSMKKTARREERAPRTRSS